jgi:F-type H+-transporting ATPase subunit epsilon
MPLHLDIVTPASRVASLAVDSLRAPGAEGQFGVLPGHTPFIAAMDPGELTYVTGGREHRYFVGGGFVEVAEDRVIVLAEAAEAAQDIDVDRARRALQDAQTRLAQLKAEEDAAAIERARVKRAAARISVASRRS